MHGIVSRTLHTKISNTSEIYNFEKFYLTFGHFVQVSRLAFGLRNVCVVGVGETITCQMTEFAAFRACEILVGLSIGFRRRVWLFVVIVPGEVEVFVRLLVDSWNILIHEWYKDKPNLTLIINPQFLLFFKRFSKMRIQIVNSRSHGVSKNQFTFNVSDTRVRIHVPGVEPRKCLIKHNRKRKLFFVTNSNED